MTPDDVPVGGGLATQERPGDVVQRRWTDRVRVTDRLRVPAWLLAGLLALGDVVLAVVLYKVYAALRNAQGKSDTVGPATDRARHHADDVLSLERFLHLDAEHAVQSFALSLPGWVVRAADVYYASVHLPLTGLVLIWLLVTRPRAQYAFWRNTLVIGTAVALAGFALFPTMPPRLMPPGSGIVDTLATHGGLWSYRTPALEHIAHPFAAMPSLHMVWAFWVGSALWRCARWVWLRRLGLLHMVVTAVVVVVTGNHWTLDVLAGAAVFVVAVAASELVPRPGRLRS